MAQQTQINGNRYSFTNITVVANGIVIPRGVFKSINYDCSQDPGIVQGNQTTIIGRTGGYATATGSFEILVSEADDFFAALSLFNLGGPIMGVDFDIQVSYSVNDIFTRQDDLLGCRITRIGSSNSSGNDATIKACDLSIARVNLNGIPAFGDSIF